MTRIGDESAGVLLQVSPGASFSLNMNAAHYAVSRTAHGYALVLELGNGEGELIGYYPTRREANDVKATLLSLRHHR